MTRFGKTSKLVAAALGGALVLSACGGGNGDDDDNTSDESQSGGGGTVILAYEQEVYSWNPTAADANAAANSIPTYWVTTGFWYFGENGVVTANDEFGSYEKVSDDPLIVEYTINENAVWSDGTPIDCDDVLLHWSQQGGYLGWGASGYAGMEDVKLPDCEPGDKEFTYEYRKPFADWESVASGQGNNAMMPAHVVAEQGGLTPEELVEIIKGVDWEDPDAREAGAEEANEQLADAIEFFTTGWLIEGGLPDAAHIPSSGPFTFGEYQPGESLTLVPNENYWGEAPNADEVIIRYIEQNEQAQALQNGEVDIIAPQPSPDLKAQLEAMDGVEVSVFDQYIYEHVTLNFDSGPFAESPELREAFLLCLPRETIVENLIRPVDEDAQVLNSTVMQAFEPGYDELISGSLPSEYSEQDIDAARQILEDNDAVGTTIELRTLDNPRRNQQGQLIADACTEAGFEVDFEAHGDFFEGDGAMYNNRFHAAMFAWQGSSLVSGWNSTYRTPSECSASDKGNNSGCYSNEDMDRMLDEVLRITDEGERNEMLSDISAHLWENGVVAPLFSHPGMAAWSEDVENIVPNPAQSDIVWNMPEWQRSS
ncbi:ABC transporter substrate-binding protein [Streptomyces calidiresistens]|uniref:ABC transporter family substrate-binding protein n=1 Tax=Streptomyces calidiresistens TaxID=1485586 RepID=A0A7W3T1E3_9ACTN|nr:ABC transporter substrate-binding protein [Streptomyces calidiresistens]MBB0229127.1 ABC transporter family substrate-binding protein [Streptomyces calidiresistens]